MSSDAPATAVPAAEAPFRFPRRRPWYFSGPVRLFREKPLGFLGLVIIILLLLMALFAPLLTKHSPYDIDSLNILAQPSSDHWLGTDQQGRDLWARIVYGSRASVYAGFGSIAVATLIATIIGVSSGYIGGKYDLLLQRVVDAFMAFPWLLFLLTFAAIFGNGLWQVILALGIIIAFGTSRVVRSATVSEKENAYVQAARSMGASPQRIMLRHVLPNLFAPIMVVATAGLGGAILAEASLSFLGLGVPPPTPTWGRMLSGTTNFWKTNPLLPLAPGIAISLVVFAFNMFGDALRDLADPRLRRG
jgi:peptide/nickel transport system permease protein